MKKTKCQECNGTGSVPARRRKLCDLCRAYSEKFTNEKYPLGFLRMCSEWFQTFEIIEKLNGRAPKCYWKDAAFWPVHRESWVRLTPKEYDELREEIRLQENRED